jgi:hypothetical protein
MDLARSMETSCKTIIHHYTNFIMMTPIALNAPTKDKGVFKDGLIDFMTENAHPNMFDSVEEMFAKIQRAFPNQITAHDRSKLSQACQRATESKAKRQKRFHCHLRELHDLITSSSSSASSSSSSSSSFSSSSYSSSSSSDWTLQARAQITQLMQQWEDLQQVAL